jgi:hypothetical protein
MKIAAYVPVLQETERSSFKNFIVETFFLMLHQNFENTYIIITNNKPKQHFSENTEIIIKPQPGNGLLKKLWWDIKLPAILKKQKPALFISFDNSCSSAASIPQIIIVSNAEKAKSSYLKKARLVIVKSESAGKK